MTKTVAEAIALPRGAIPLQLQRDKDGQFFDLPKGWKFTNGKVTLSKVAGGLMLTPVRPGKLKLPQSAKQPLDYPKQAKNSQKYPLKTATAQ